MLVHKFILIDEVSLVENIDNCVKKMEKLEIVRISDYIVLENIALFCNGFRCYWDSIEYEGCGLNYHGISIIPNEEIMFFLSNIKKVKKLNWKLKGLYRMCEKAINMNYNIIHFGI